MTLRAAQIADALNRLDFVVWDRIVERTYSTSVYGWIAMAGGERDFVSLTFSCREGSLVLSSIETSSDHYATEIRRRLVPWGANEAQLESERIEDAFGDLVKSTVPRRALRRVV